MLPYAFHLRWGGVLWPVFIYCDAEVMLHLLHEYDTTLSFFLLSYILACDLYFDSHILLYLIITLILIIHINCINCISVREYPGYSLTVYKSLF